MKKRLLVTLFSLFLAACGGGSGGETTAGNDSSSDGNTSDNGGNSSGNNPDNGGSDNSTPVSNSLYTGYYSEDAASNPEDPTIGSVYLSLPEQGAFKGSMYFTYYGCQSNNVGSVSGTKTANNLSANWTGKIDGTNQSGSFSGTYNNTKNSYSGTYTVNKGKQKVVIDDCIEYYIAPHGTWVLYAQNTSSIDNSCSVSNGVASWNPPADAAISVVAIIDKNLANSGANNAIISQQVIVNKTSWQLPTNLTQGKSYVVTINSFDQNRTERYNCNTTFQY